MKLLSKIFLVSSAVMAITGCYYDIEEELYPASPLACDTANVTFAGSVQPLLQTNCFSCHTGSAPSGNINLMGYANVKTVADNGKLMGAVTHSAGFSPMPQGGNKLSDCEILIIQTWIDKGTLNN